MAASDGQVVFSVEMDDTAFQAGMQRLTLALGALSDQVRASLKINAAQFAQAYAAGVTWVRSMAAGVAASQQLGAEVTGKVEAASQAGRLAAQTGGQSVGQSMVAAAAEGVAGRAVALDGAVRAAVLAGAAAGEATAQAGSAGIGQEMVNGMASGVSSRGNFLNTAVMRVVRAALQAARNAAGIQSPSRLFRDELGLYLAQGMAQGFTEGAQASVLPAVGKGVAAAAQAGRRALEGAFGGLGFAGWQPALSAGDAAIRVAALQGSPARSAQAVQSAQATDRVVHVTQNITFEAAMQAPDEIARAIRKQVTYGLAGARGAS